MTVFDILTLIFGISLFLFGMNLMSNTLKKSAGKRLKLILGKLTDSKIKGFALGLAVTAVIQSSSAATVMVVGFVNSGSMLLSQAVGVIMGANVGTTVTSWLTSLSGIGNGQSINTFMQWFKPSSFTPIVALIGLILYMLGKNDSKKNLGMIFLGFSVLMVGMETMSEAVSGLSQNENFRSLLLAFENPILGLVAGLILTAITQSSSASIGILQSFTSTGAITFGNAVPIIMGQNIGTCVTALISSLGTNKNAKRAAVVHLLFNVFGSVICMLLFYTLIYLFRPDFINGSINMWEIAGVHTVFNIISFITLFPLSKKIEKLTIRLVNDKNTDDKFIVFDERLLATPSVAIEKSREETLKMACIAIQSFNDACRQVKLFDRELSQKIKNNENNTDEYEDKIGTYLVKISEKSIIEGEKAEIARLLHMIGDFERISDHAVNLSESAEEMKEKNIKFSSDAEKEISVLIDAVLKITELSYKTVLGNDHDTAYRVEPLEQVIDKLCMQIKSNHILRLQSGECTMEQGFVLSDILSNLERVADHCSNIAVCFIKMSEKNDFSMHKYLRGYKNESEKFNALFEEYSKKYSLI